jgi:hypothetical protein
MKGSSSGLSPVTVRYPIAVRAVALVAIVTVAACKDSGPKPLVATSIVKVLGDSQVALVGTLLPTAPAVEARTSSGAKVPDVPVQFTVVGGNGSVSSATVITDDNGRASTAWTLGPNFGTHSLKATAPNLPEVQFTATAAAVATQLAATSPSQVAGSVSQSHTLIVTARDALGATKTGAVVIFTLASGVGTVASGTVVTDANGRATTTFTPGAAGSSIVSAQLAGTLAAPGIVAFEVAAVAGLTLNAVSSTSFSTNGGENRTITVRANSPGGVVANVPVQFTVSSGGGTSSVTSAMTNVSGDAITEWTLPATSGTRTLTATGAGQNVTFTATVTFDPLLPTQLTAVFGDSVYVTPATTQSLTARVMNAAGSSIANVPVVFRATTPGSLVGPTFIGPFADSTMDTTTAGGTAIAYIKTPNSVGTHIATATTATLSRQFRVHAVNVGPPVSFTKGGDQQATAAGDRTLLGLAVNLKDEHGLYVPNFPVSYSVTSGGGVLLSFSPYQFGEQITVNTSMFGLAGAQFRPGLAPGTNTVTATVAGFAPITFTVQGSALSACSGIVDHTPPGSVSSSLSSFDCIDFFSGGSGDRFYTEPYRFTLASQQVVQFSMSGSFAPALTATNATRYIAHEINSNTNGAAVLRLMLAPGTYYLGASSNLESTSGSYTLTSLLNPDLSTGTDPFAVRGVTVPLTVRATNPFSNAPFKAQPVKIFLWGGEQVTLEMQAGGFDAYLGLWDIEAAAWVATDDNSGGGTNAKIIYTALHPGLYTVYAGVATNTTPVAGQFTLIIP